MSMLRFSILAGGLVGMGLLVALTLAHPAPAQARAVLLGAGLALANSLAAYASSVLALRQSPRVFMGVILGGMGVRMTLLLVAVVVAVTIAGVPRVPLVLALLGHFVALLALELVALHRRTSCQAVRP